MSIKALAIGVLTNIAVTVVIMVVAAFVAAIIAIGAPGTAPAMASDTAAFWILGIMLAFSCATAGYVAASFAPSRRLLHGALSALLLPLIVLYGHFGGLLPEPRHDHDIPWYINDYAIMAVPPLLGLAGAYIQSQVRPNILGRWTGAVLAMVVIYLSIGALCLAVTHALFSYSLAAMVAIIVAHFIAPLQHRRIALFLLAGLLAAAFALECAGFAISRSSQASASLVIAANVASGCVLAVVTMWRHCRRGSGGGTPSAS